MDVASAYEEVGHTPFLDVREPHEYVAGHVEGAIHIPIGQVVARLEEIPKDRRIIVTCQVGQRSALVTEYLNANGFDAQNLEGGLVAWAAAGYPLVAGEAPTGAVIDGWARDLTGRRLSNEPD